MSVLAPILQRISPLVGKLGTDHDGEIVAVVRQLRRVLADERLTFNDLSLALELQPARVVYLEAEPTEPRTWREVARWIVHHDRARLQPHERKFTEDMTRRLVMQGTLSEKQAKWLGVLYAKLGEQGQ